MGRLIQPMSGTEIETTPGKRNTLRLQTKIPQPLFRRPDHQLENKKLARIRREAECFLQQNFRDVFEIGHRIFPGNGKQIIRPFPPGEKRFPHLPRRGNAHFRSVRKQQMEFRIFHLTLIRHILFFRHKNLACSLWF